VQTLQRAQFGMASFGMSVDLSVCGVFGLIYLKCQETRVVSLFKKG